jgi:hypothetical protein
MTMPSDDEILETLRRLPARPLDPAAAERVRRRSHRVLDEERRLADRPTLRTLRRLWSGEVEPVLVAATVGGYLLWAFTAARALYR